MSKKKKIIISVTAIVLVFATALTCVASIIGRQNDIKQDQDEYEQAQNANKNNETTEPTDTTNPDSEIPPVVVPDDTGDSTVKDGVILDVSELDRDPNPGIVDATIEYDTKEGADNVE